MSTPPCVLDTVSPWHIVKLLLPRVKFIAASGAIVVEPVNDTWSTGLLHPNALLTVVIVNPYTVSTAKPTTAGFPNNVNEFVADWTILGAVKAAALIPGSVDEIVNGVPFLDVILKLFPPTTKTSTRSPVPAISDLNPFNISTISLSFCGAPVFIV